MSFCRTSAQPTGLTQRESQVADRGGPLVGGCQVIIRKAWSWTIVGDVFGECHAPCTSNTPFVVFEEE